MMTAGKVKEISFTKSQNADVIGTNLTAAFPSLAGKDLTRYVSYLKTFWAPWTKLKSPALVTWAPQAIATGRPLDSSLAQEDFLDKDPPTTMPYLK